MHMIPIVEPTSFDSPIVHQYKTYIKWCTLVASIVSGFPGR